MPSGRRGGLRAERVQDTLGQRSELTGLGRFQVLPVAVQHRHSVKHPEPFYRAQVGVAGTGAGISGLHFHDLRGSGATWAAAAGATAREVMERLGHTTATVALRYQHATQERDRAIADKLGALTCTATSDTGEEGATVVSIDR